MKAWWFATENSQQNLDTEFLKHIVRRLIIRGSTFRFEPQKDAKNSRRNLKSSLEIHKAKLPGPKLENIRRFWLNGSVESLPRLSGRKQERAVADEKVDRQVLEVPIYRGKAFEFDFVGFRCPISSVFQGQPDRRRSYLH